MSIKATQPEDSAEREAFEAWAVSEEAELDISKIRNEICDVEAYAKNETFRAWQAWYARSERATPSPQPATTKEAEGEALQLRSWIDTAIEAITDGDTGSKASALSALRKAQAAAVDGMTDTARLDFLIEKQMLFAWSTQWTGGNYSNLRAIGTISAKGIESKDVRQVIDAAIATQEGG